MHFLRAAEGLSLPEFFERWGKAHAPAMERAPDAAAAQRRCVHSRQVPEFNEVLAYFGGLEVFYEGVAGLWFDNFATIGAFRAYERALLEINADPRTAFYRPAQSFSTRRKCRSTSGLGRSH
ncbi:MAG TPA: EthD domain-containing protein [Ramlibacter sp.]|nr:EthD domain-containing protein [Ramlibacter sp.]